MVVQQAIRVPLVDRRGRTVRGEEGGVTLSLGLGSIKVSLDTIREMVVERVRPPEAMLRFYELIGRLPDPLGTLLVLSTSIDAMKLVWQAGVRRRTDAAIQVLYQYHQPKLWRGPWALGDMLWQNSYNARSVRARGWFVQQAVRLLLGTLAEQRAGMNGRGNLAVLSLGSGSATQLLEGIKMAGVCQERLDICLVDFDSESLRVGMDRAALLADGVWSYEGRVSRFFSEVDPTGYDIVEMVGLADYFGRKRLRKCVSDVFSCLNRGGYFVGANISSKEEFHFCHRATRWPWMFYRSEERLSAMLLKAGFSWVWTGKCGLYTIWVARK